MGQAHQRQQEDKTKKTVVGKPKDSGIKVSELIVGVPKKNSGPAHTTWKPKGIVKDGSLGQNLNGDELGIRPVERAGITDPA